MGVATFCLRSVLYIFMNEREYSGVPWNDSEALPGPWPPGSANWSIPGN